MDEGIPERERKAVKKDRKGRAHRSGGIERVVGDAGSNSIERVVGDAGSNSKRLGR